MFRRTRPLPPLHPLTVALGAAFALSAQAADDGATTVAPAVTVIGQTPLPGLELPLGQIAAPVQSVTAREIDESGASDVSAFMNRRLGGVHVNEVQGNPFQMDVNYRGYTASPLLGTPQGLSVYMDGVRINQPFGDVVSWDLIPKAAIASMNLMPGSNPLFGLNTLGGALAGVRADDLDPNIRRDRERRLEARIVALQANRPAPTERVAADLAAAGAER